MALSECEQWRSCRVCWLLLKDTVISEIISVALLLYQPFGLAFSECKQLPSNCFRLSFNLYSLLGKRLRWFPWCTAVSSPIALTRLLMTELSEDYQVMDVRREVGREGEGRLIREAMTDRKTRK